MTLNQFDFQTLGSVNYIDRLNLKLAVTIKNTISASFVLGKFKDTGKNKHVVSATTNDDGTIYIPLDNLEIKLLFNCDDNNIYSSLLNIQAFDISEIDMYENTYGLFTDSESHINSIVRVGNEHLLQNVINLSLGNSSTKPNNMYIVPIILRNQTLVIEKLGTYLTDEKLVGSKNINFNLQLNDDKHMVFTGIDRHIYQSIYKQKSSSDLNMLNIGIQYVNNKTLQALNTSVFKKKSKKTTNATKT